MLAYDLHYLLLDALGHTIGGRRILQQEMGPKIACEDHHHIAEINGAALPIGQPAIVEHLK